MSVTNKVALSKDSGNNEKLQVGMFLRRETMAGSRLCQVVKLPTFSPDEENYILVLLETGTPWPDCGDDYGGGKMFSLDDLREKVRCCRGWRIYRGDIKITTSY